VVVQVEHEALRYAHERQTLTYPWGSPELAHQLFEATAMNPLETRFFAVIVDGEPVSYTDLYLDPPDAQIEAVYTDPEHRGRGYASAVVTHASDQARLAGATFVFLVADADDWPQELYRRLGFDEVGRYFGFTLRDVSAGSPAQP
jgi:ribosomal protein S18 acetylase RimI-like enzyme